MIKVGQHYWYTQWDSLEPHYCVVLKIRERIKIKLVDDRELWVEDFELSEDLDNG